MDYLIAVVPSIVLAVLFYILIRVLFNADRGERKAQARIDAAVAKALAENDFTTPEKE